ncbi:P-loop containing nucleoside triphosphate hydrolase protein, partial [Mycena albidolilacea]
MEEMFNEEALQLVDTLLSGDLLDNTILMDVRAHGWFDDYRFGIWPEVTASRVLKARDSAQIVVPSWTPPGARTLAADLDGCLHEVSEVFIRSQNVPASEEVLIKPVRGQKHKKVGHEESGPQIGLPGAVFRRVCTYWIGDENTPNAHILESGTTLQDQVNMLAAPPTTRTICAPFVQRNLHIHRVTLHPNDDRATFLELLLPHLAQQYMGDQGQGIVFLNAKQDVDDIHAHCIPRGIDAVRSYANYGPWESDEELWMAGGARWIIATGTLIHGIDNANCVVVIVVDWDPGLIRLAQWWGRAGRKGQPGYAFLRVTPDADPDVQCFRQSRLVFTNQTECRRLVFGETFNNARHTCGELQASACDLCDPNSELAKQIRDWLPA